MTIKCIMEYNKSFKSLSNYCTKNLLDSANDCQNGYIKLFNNIMSSGKIPDEGLSDFQIDFCLNQFSIMDSNNIIGKIGMGEREARVNSNMIKSRYFNMLHGIGRSGELLAMQPKAVGSSILQKVTHMLIRDALIVFGIGNVGKLLILPVATGMSLTLCFLNLKIKKPKAKFVIFLRIDQKSCAKSIFAAGLEAIMIDNVQITNGKKDWQNIELNKIEKSDDIEHLLEKNEKDTNKNSLKTDILEDEVIYGLTTDLDKLKDCLKNVNTDDILCILSTSSCFAPREPDDVFEIGKLAREKGIYHVVNNAYGLQSSKTCDMINKANAQNLIDYVVQSTDKNFLVPVGGSVVFSQNSQLIQELNNNYPGRASANIVLDLFISLLNNGKIGLKNLLNERKMCFDLLKKELIKIAQAKNEKVIENKRNNISIAFTLTNFGEHATEFGAWLFRKGIMGARVVKNDQNLKNINSLNFYNFGGHTDQKSTIFPYITLAAAIGCTETEILKFLKIFVQTYDEFLTKLNKKKE